MAYNRNPQLSRICSAGTPGVLHMRQTPATYIGARNCVAEMETVSFFAASPKTAEFVDAKWKEL